MKNSLGRLGLAAVLLFIVGFWTIPYVQSKAAARPRKVVRFWHMWTAEWKDKVDMIVARFNESQTEYEVEALSVPSAGADSKFLLGVMGGDPPDLMAQWNSVIPAWADAGLIIPLEDLMNPEEKATFDRDSYPVAKKIGTYKGKLYGLSIGINMNAIYYRPDQFRAAGIDPKEAFKSLESVDAAGRKLDQFAGGKSLKRLGWMPDRFAFYAPLFGGGFWDEKAQKVTIDTPANLRALQYIVANRKRLGFDEVTRFNAGLNTVSSAAGWPFIDGAYSIAVDGQWRTKQVADFAPKLEYATVPVPPPIGGIPGAGTSNGNFMIVPRGAKEQKGAWAFMSFWSGLLNPEVAAEFYTMGGWLPLTRPVAKARIYQKYISDHPQFGPFVDLMSSDKMQVQPPVPYQTFLADEVTKAEDAAVRGNLTPSEALRQLQAKVDAEIQRRKDLGE